MRARTRALKRTKINERVYAPVAVFYPALSSLVTVSLHLSPALRPIIYLTFSARDIIMDALTALTM